MSGDGGPVRRLALNETVGPHAFEPLRRLFNRGRCKACYWPKEDHPREWWSIPRPLGDSRPPEYPESREGMVTVRDSQGRYQGCMGEETWRRIAGGVDQS